MDENHWFTESCARAFWDQKEGDPYKRLVNDTIALAQPKPGEHWLDLGCGSGQLSSALWLSAGSLDRLICLDCAEANRGPIHRWRAKYVKESSSRTNELFHFIPADFSNGLSMFPDSSFDGVVSGLAISYAQSRDPRTGQYTDVAFRRLLSEVRRVLRPAGRFVFSINVPNPRFGRVLWKSLGSGLRISKPGRQFVSALKMMWYGRWLRNEARRGRFHYPHIVDLTKILREAGFASIDHGLAYAGQAYVVRALPATTTQSTTQRRSA